MEKVERRVAWLEILNALAMIYVVLGHVCLTGEVNDPSTPITNYIVRFGACQMGLFMFVSGFSFVRFSLSHKDFSYSNMMKSKVYRLVIPFLFFSLVVYVFKLCLPASLLKHSVSFDLSYISSILINPWKGPQPHLWFLMTLFWMFALSPALIWSLKKRWSKVVVLTVFVFFVFLC